MGEREREREREIPADGWGFNIAIDKQLHSSQGSYRLIGGGVQIDYCGGFHLKDRKTSVFHTRSVIHTI